MTRLFSIIGGNVGPETGLYLHLDSLIMSDHSGLFLLLLQVCYPWPWSFLQEEHWSRGDGHRICRHRHPLSAHGQKGEVLRWQGQSGFSSFDRFHSNVLYYNWRLKFQKVSGCIKRLPFFCLRRVLAVICSALTTLMWWMLPCTATQRGSSTTRANPTATLEWSTWKAASILSSLLFGRSTGGRSSPMTTSSPSKTPAANSTATAGPGDVAGTSTETPLVWKWEDPVY